jgi:hypothetical protein
MGGGLEHQQQYKCLVADTSADTLYVYVAEKKTVGEKTKYDDHVAWRGGGVCSQPLFLQPEGGVRTDDRPVTDRQGGTPTRKAPLPSLVGCRCGIHDPPPSPSPLRWLLPHPPSIVTPVGSIHSQMTLQR